MTQKHTIFYSHPNMQLQKLPKARTHENT